MGHLYQLYSKFFRSNGDNFPIDGPWDKHGYAVKFIHEEPQGYLYLIRGTGKKKRRQYD